MNRHARPAGPFLQGILELALDERSKAGLESLPGLPTRSWC